MQTTESQASDEKSENAVVGGVVVFAIALALAVAGWKTGLIGGGGRSNMLSAAAPVFAAVHKEAGGDPAKILVSGFVLSEAERKSLIAGLQRQFPKSELKDALRIDSGKPPPGKKPQQPRKSTVRVSFAADAINEAWPRPRFGETKRLELVWKEEKVTLRGAVFAASAKTTLEKGFEQVSKDKKGIIQLREVVRPVVPAADLQKQVSSAIAERFFSYAADGTIDAKDPKNAELVAAIAPLLKDLRGLDLWVSAGHADRATSLKNAEQVKAALVAAGADAAGLRPVPAPENNKLNLIVREKE